MSPWFNCFFQNDVNALALRHIDRCYPGLNLDHVAVALHGAGCSSGPGVIFNAGRGLTPGVLDWPE